MHKKSLKLFVTMAMTVMVSTTVFAAPTEADLSNTKKELTNVQNAYNAADNNYDKLNTDIQMLEASMLDVSEKQKKIKIDIENKQLEIKKSEKEVEAAKKKVEETQDLFNKRVRIMYKSGNETAINIVFEAKSFGDMIDRIEGIKTIAKYDKQVLKELSDQKAELEYKKASLEEESKALVGMQQQLDSSMANLKKDMTNHEVLVAKAEALKAQYSDQLEATKEEYNTINAYILEQKSKAPKYNPSGGAANLSANSIVAYASNFMGTKYVWGGTTPSGFDCSGYVQYVYAHFGIRITRTTYTQIHDGWEVSADQLKPGDLVFFGSRSAPHHVGMYVSDGWFIHAPRTGDVIKVSKLSTRSDFCMARRIANVN